MAAPMYTDFNIVWSKDLDLLDLVTLAIRLGYERVAVSNFLPDLKGGKKHKDKIAIAPPSEIKLKEDEVKSLQLKLNGRKFEQLSRLTAVLEDTANTHRLSSPEIQAYDILAVQPTNEKTFQLACSTLEVDIICLNLAEPFGFILKRPLMKLAAERGVHFEINYSSALDSNLRRLTIANAMNLIEISRGKNIILSSAAKKMIELRSPYDVINLSKIFGLDHTQAKNSISKNSRAVLMHAASRKSCKSVISCSLASSLASSDKWVVDAHSKLMDKSDSEEDDESSSDEEDSFFDNKETDPGEPAAKKLKA